MRGAKDSFFFRFFVERGVDGVWGCECVWLVGWRAVVSLITLASNTPDPSVRSACSRGSGCWRRTAYVSNGRLVAGCDAIRGFNHSCRSTNPRRLSVLSRRRTGGSGAGGTGDKGASRREEEQGGGGGRSSETGHGDDAVLLSGRGRSVAWISCVVVVWTCLGQRSSLFQPNVDRLRKGFVCVIF